MKFETYGEIEYRGKKFYLEDRPQGPFKVIQKGLTLLVQYECDAVDGNGMYHQVIWRFNSDDIKCTDCLCLSDMDWSEKNIYDVVMYDLEIEDEE